MGELTKRIQASHYAHGHHVGLAASLAAAAHQQQAQAQSAERYKELSGSVVDGDHQLKPLSVVFVCVCVCSLFLFVCAFRACVCV